MKFIRKYLPHLTIALALSMATITVLNGYNPMMSFLTSPQSKLLIGLFCVSAILLSVDNIIRRK